MFFFDLFVSLFTTPPLAKKASTHVKRQNRTSGERTAFRFPCITKVHISLPPSVSSPCRMPVRPRPARDSVRGRASGAHTQLSGAHTQPSGHAPPAAPLAASQPYAAGPEYIHRTELHGREESRVPREPGECSQLSHRPTPIHAPTPRALHNIKKLGTEWTRITAVPAAQTSQP